MKQCPQCSIFLLLFNFESISTQTQGEADKQTSHKNVINLLYSILG